MLALAARVLDGLLTFVVFADAQNRYGQFALPMSFLLRAGAYALAIVIAFSWHRMSRRRCAVKNAPDNAVVIQTSPYSESRLRM